MKTKPISELHTEHTDWMKRLDFYTDEVGVMKARIEWIASQNTDKEILAQVEHFQNQLIIQKEQIDELKHSINEHEHFLEKNINENSVAADHRKLQDHPLMRERIDTFEKIYKSLRQELYNFLTKTM